MNGPDRSPVSRQRRIRIGLLPRSWVSIALLALVIAVASAGATLFVLVEFRGYCAAQFLPVTRHPEAAPYVQDLSGTAATIMWRTDDETEGLVEYGEHPEASQTVRSDTGYVHAVRLTDLEPDTTYAYRVQSEGTWTGMRTFQTPPGPNGAVTAVVVGDTGTGSSAQWQLSEVMLQVDPDLVLHTGDVVYPRGGACHYEDRFYEPYEEMLASVPIYPVLGNHDVLTDNGDPFLTAFSLPTENSGTERYYSFDFGPLHVTALNAELYYEDDSISPARQLAWLREDLQSTDRPWKIVVIHRPPFNSSPYHGADPNVLVDMVDIFEEEGVDVVFAGHEHAYERLRPINGVTYFVTGGGGAELRGAGTSDLTALSALRYHVLRMEASPERLQIEAVGIDGEVFDQSWEQGQPATFGIGVQQVIPCWDELVVGAAVGSRLELICTPEDAYGDQDYNGIPGGSTLIFSVDILAAQ